MKDEDDRPAAVVRSKKLPWGIVILIVVLTGTVWVFFFEENMPLDSGSTGVVALAVVIMVMLSRWLLMRGKRRRASK